LSVGSRSVRGPSFRSPQPWGTPSPTRRGFASTACPSALTGSSRGWPSCPEIRTGCLLSDASQPRGLPHCREVPPIREVRMEPAAPNPARPNLEVHGARASTVITQHIPPGAREAFLEWQRGLSDAAAEAPGYQTTELYPPAGGQEPWVIVIHFDNPKTLRDWLDSPRRAEWLAKIPHGIGDFR